MNARRAAVALAILAVAPACSLKPIDLSAERPLALRSTIRSADGGILARLYQENRIEVPLVRMPQHLIDAVLAAEDARFFEHPGFDIKAIARAALVNSREDRVVQGGSTITQQYVKNVYFRDPKRTFQRKARELRLALEVERLYSKEEILERYLNTIYLGQGTYGVGAAAETYFGARVSDLTIADSALLAALIKAPTDHDPRAHPERAIARRNYVIRRMSTLGMITLSEAGRAFGSRLSLTPHPPRTPTREPYFVEAVKRELLADRRLGVTAQDRARTLFQGGINVETTLVPRLQRAAEASVRRILSQPGDPEAALVAIRPRTGEIVAMVGGRSWRASQVNLALGRAGGGSGRQSGSSFKPIVAAAAMEAGIPLSTTYESAPATFTFEDGVDPWPVHNSEGGGFGRVPLDEAMVRSINGVYARLALDLGPNAIVTQAHLMGVSSKLPPYPSISLGSADISVLDMAAAYATLANHGTAVQPTTIRRVRFPDGQALRPDQEIVQGAVSPGNAYLLTKVLENVITRGTGTAARIDRPAAGKTGTTNDYTDAWFVGYTPQLVTAVWVGYPDALIPMTSVHGIRVYGGTFPAQIWRGFMLEALRGERRLRFSLPKSELVTVEIDPESGLLAAPWCPGRSRTMLRQLVPTQTCPLPPPPPPTPEPTPTPTPTKTPKPKDDPTPKPTPKPTTRPTPKPTPTG